ncbi:MAG: DUF2007 domain-containing protein [Acidobacteria bacterium]|nr:DUF2007 domain-containing protein [Acidobacteriota bacterium]MCI0663848.1 DUF2007 domain-containing protein [Acidobacteriota bacterium]
MKDRENKEQDTETVTLAYFSNAAEAGMACELLTNNGINACLRGANFGALEPLPMVGGFSEIELIVQADDLERAQEIYNAYFESEEETLEEDKDVNNE